MLSQLFLTTFFSCVFVTQASDAKINLPDFALEWKNAIASTQIDLTQISQVKKAAGDDETYIATLQDKTEIIATKLSTTKRIQCTRCTRENSFVVLEDKFFDQIKFIYFQNCYKK